jgi:hypothetical protein
MIAHELRDLNESLQPLAYAALGRQGPNPSQADRMTELRSRRTR